MNFIKSKYVIGLASLVIIILIAYFVYSRNLPTVSPSLSGTGSILLTKEAVTINLEECAPDIRLIDVERNPTIIEVVEKKFDVCIVNYGPALHKRNLIQRLPNRCQIPWEGRSSISLPVFEKIRIDLSVMSEFCEPKTIPQTP